MNQFLFVSGSAYGQKQCGPLHKPASYNDRSLRQEINHDPEQIQRLVETYINAG